MNFIRLSKRNCSRHMLVFFASPYMTSGSFKACSHLVILTKMNSRMYGANVKWMFIITIDFTQCQKSLLLVLSNSFLQFYISLYECVCLLSASLYWHCCWCWRKDPGPLRSPDDKHGGIVVYWCLHWSDITIQGRWWRHQVLSINFLW